MRQAFGPGALGRPRGSRRRGRWEGESGWGIHVYPRLTHVNVWHKPLQYCKVISLQLIKKKKKKVCDHQKNKNVYFIQAPKVRRSLPRPAKLLLFINFW